MGKSKTILKSPSRPNLNTIDERIFAQRPFSAGVSNGMDKLSRVGIDLAKNVFQLHGVNHHEKTVWKRRLKRDNWLNVLQDKVEPGCGIGMEACSGAHHWVRLLQAKGFTVKLIAPQFVKPYLKSNKNNANDAEAICEVMSRPSMRFLNVKATVQRIFKMLTAFAQS